MNELTHEAEIAEIAELAKAQENVKRLTMLIEHPGAELPAQLKPRLIARALPATSVAGISATRRA